MSLLYLRTATIFNCGCEVAWLSAPISLCVIFLNFFLTFVSRSYGSNADSILGIMDYGGEDIWD